jgi:hypothetical protein
VAEMAVRWRGRLRRLRSCFQLGTLKLFSNSLNGDGACCLDVVLCADNELFIDDCHGQDGINTVFPLSILDGGRLACFPTRDEPELTDLQLPELHILTNKELEQTFFGIPNKLQNTNVTIDDCYNDIKKMGSYFNDQRTLDILSTMRRHELQNHLYLF